MTRPLFRAGKRLWLKKHDAEFRRLYPHLPSVEVAKRMERSLAAVYGHAGKLGLMKSAAYLASPAACRLRRGDNVGARFRFPKGHVPANKGLRRPGYSVGRGRMQETQFKKGQPTRWMPVGSTRLGGGYLYRKVSDIRNVTWTRNWKQDHVLVWEAAHGPLPTGHVVAFVNGDRTDIRLENLEVVHRRELARRNSIHRLPAELKSAVMAIGRLTRAIRRRTKAHEEQDRRSA